MDERYKRIYIELPYTPRHLEQESEIDAKLNDFVKEWAVTVRKKFPGMNYRIVNAETSTIPATDTIQSEPSSIRFLVHLAYTV